jgi:hypothetical protein
MVIVVGSDSVQKRRRQNIGCSALATPSSPRSASRAVSQRCENLAKSAEAGALHFPPLGQSENLGILPGGFFAGLLTDRR